MRDAEMRENVDVGCAREHMRAVAPSAVPGRGCRRAARGAAQRGGRAGGGDLRRGARGGVRSYVRGPAVSRCAFLLYRCTV
jgi:hypothetical protein